jgi:hypothetical protein
MGMTKCEEIMQFQVRPNDLIVAQAGEVKATNTHEVRLPSAKAEHATFSHLVLREVDHQQGQKVL